MDYNHLDIRSGHPLSETPPTKPVLFDEMKALASKLSKGFPFIRIDFYEVNHDVYFGEFTFFHHSGLVPFEPDDWNYRLGDLIILPLK